MGFKLGLSLEGHFQGIWPWQAVLAKGKRLRHKDIETFAKSAQIINFNQNFPSLLQIESELPDHEVH